MAKMALSREESRQAILRGVNAFADSVKTKLGPRGHSATQNRELRSAVITSGGTTTSNGLRTHESLADAGTRMVRDVAAKTGVESGDGTTTTAVLAQAIFRGSSETVAAGACPVAVRRGIDRAVEVAAAQIQKFSTSATGDMIAQVATISAGNDPAIGALIAEAMKRVGRDGLITAKKASAPETTLDVVDGLRFGGIAVIRVGATNETELKEKMVRIEDAIRATSAAVEEGVVAGGGVTFVRVIPTLENMKLEGDEQIGLDIVKRALEEPLRLIASNAGYEGAIVVGRVRNSSRANHGFDAAKEEYVDMMAAGIIDPSKVTRSALRNAASGAALMLSMETLTDDH